MLSDPSAPGLVTVSTDGQILYRASALGSCTRALVAARQGYGAIAASGKMKALFDAGHAVEDVGVDILGRQGKHVDLRQREVALEVTNKILVVGHLDGNLGTHLLEIKSQGDAEWNEDYTTWPLWDKYSWQISVYMHACRSPLWLMQIRRSDEKYAMHEILRPPKSLAEIRARVLEIEGLAALDLSVINCNVDMYPCPYFYTHDVVVRELIDDEALEGLLSEYKAAADEGKVARARQDKARAAILEWTGAIEVGESKKYDVGRWALTVSRYTVKERKLAAGEQVKVTITERKVVDGT